LNVSVLFWRTKLIGATPCHNIKLPIIPKTILRALTPDEDRALLRAATLRNRALLLFALRSGVRAEELCSLSVGDVDMTSGAGCHPG
jgi:integrase